MEPFKNGGDACFLMERAEGESPGASLVGSLLQEKNPPSSEWTALRRSQMNRMQREQRRSSATRGYRREVTVHARGTGCGPRSCTFSPGIFGGGGGPPLLSSFRRREFRPQNAQSLFKATHLVRGAKGFEATAWLQCPCCGRA